MQAKLAALEATVRRRVLQKLQDEQVGKEGRVAFWIRVLPAWSWDGLRASRCRPLCNLSCQWFALQGKCTPPVPPTPPIPPTQPHIRSAPLQVLAAARVAELEGAVKEAQRAQQERGGQAQQRSLGSVAPLFRKGLAKLAGAAGVAGAAGAAGKPPPAKKQAVAGGAWPSKVQPVAQPAAVHEEIEEGEVIIPETESDSDFQPVPRARPAPPRPATAEEATEAAKAAAKPPRAPMRGSGRSAAGSGGTGKKPAAGKAASFKRARVVVSDSEDEGDFVSAPGGGAAHRSAASAAQAAGAAATKSMRQLQAELAAARRAFEMVSQWSGLSRLSAGIQAPHAGCMGWAGVLQGSLACFHGPPAFLLPSQMFLFITGHQQGAGRSARRRGSGWR